jgi:hypothetical protein
MTGETEIVRACVYGTILCLPGFVAGTQLRTRLSRAGRTLFGKGMPEGLDHLLVIPVALLLVATVLHPAPAVWLKLVATLVACVAAGFESSSLTPNAR